MELQELILFLTDLIDKGFDPKTVVVLMDDSGEFIPLESSEIEIIGFEAENDPEVNGEFIVLNLNMEHFSLNMEHFSEEKNDDTVPYGELDDE